MNASGVLGRVELVKTSGTLGPKPVGSKFEWTYTTTSREMAVQRAYRALKRDHPDENPMCWTLTGEAG